MCCGSTNPERSSINNFPIPLFLSHHFFSITPASKLVVIVIVYIQAPRSYSEVFPSSLMIDTMPLDDE